jgi:hypothetical protein
MLGNLKNLKIWLAHFLAYLLFSAPRPPCLGPCTLQTVMCSETGLGELQSKDSFHVSPRLWRAEKYMLRNGRTGCRGESQVPKRATSVEIKEETGIAKHVCQGIQTVMTPLQNDPQQHHREAKHRKYRVPRGGKRGPDSEVARRELSKSGLASHFGPQKNDVRGTRDLRLKKGGG